MLALTHKTENATTRHWHCTQHNDLVATNARDRRKRWPPAAATPPRRDRSSIADGSNMAGAPDLLSTNN